MHPCTKFGVPRSKGVWARGHMVEKQVSLWGRHVFSSFGAVNPMAHVIPDYTWPESLGPLWPLLRYAPPSAWCFGAARAMWRPVTGAIVDPAFSRIEWYWSHPDPTSRSDAIHRSRWTYRRLHAKVHTQEVVRWHLQILRNSAWAKGKVSVLKSY